MNIHDMTEEAYKNGYKAGVKEFAERLKAKLDISVCGYSTEEVVSDVEDTIDYLVKEMVGE